MEHARSLSKGTSHPGEEQQLQRGVKLAQKLQQDQWARLQVDSTAALGHWILHCQQLEPHQLHNMAHMYTDVVLGCMHASERNLAQMRLI